MNTAAIIIAVLIAMLIYVLYTYYAISSSTLNKTANLNGGAIPPITISDNPKSVRYAYGIWVYINTWDNQMDKVIFSRNGNLTVTLDKNQPTLWCKVNMQDGTIKNMKIMDNFPIQKWVHIIVSVDSEFLDGYINGKLVVSQRFTDTATSKVLIPAVPPDKDTPLYLGTAGTATYVKQDIVVADFKRWNTPMDPQTAWDTYMAGNGQNTFSKMSSYGIDLSILKNSVEQSRYSLF